jgi:hypothetical protein
MCIAWLVTGAMAIAKPTNEESNRVAAKVNCLCLFLLQLKESSLMKVHQLLLVGALLALLGPVALAGTYKTITIDGDYSDWAGVPVVDNDAGDNIGGPDIGATQIANDGQKLYIRNSFPNNLSLGTFVTIDIDQDVNTGFNVFGLGLVGSEAGWQNDFPFTQATGVFNDGVGMNGGFLGIGAAELSFDGVNFANFSDRELSIDLSILRNMTNTPIFPDNTIRLLVWTDLGVGPDGTFGGFNGDVSGVIEYTLAVPEPATLGLGAVGRASFVGLRRRS